MCLGALECEGGVSCASITRDLGNESCRTQKRFPSLYIYICILSRKNGLLTCYRNRKKNNSCKQILPNQYTHSLYYVVSSYTHFTRISYYSLNNVVCFANFESIEHKYNTVTITLYCFAYCTPCLFRPATFTDRLT